MHNRATIRGAIGAQNSRSLDCNAMSKPPVGSLVVPSPAYRDTLQTGESAAILMELRRGNGHLYYPIHDRGYWVAMREVQPIPAESVPATSLEYLLSDLLLFLGAESCTINRFEDGAMSLTVEVPSTSRGHLAELARGLGERLAEFVIEPGNMRSVVMHLELTGLPPASGAG